MVKQVSEGESHHHHHGTSDHCHDHHSGQVKGLPLSARERLIIRLDRSMQHNSEHADLYGEMADAAAAAGEEEAARQIRAAIPCITRQNEYLKKALVVLQPR